MTFLTLLNYTSWNSASNIGEVTGAASGAATGEDGAAKGYLNSKTSALITRPLGPVPLIWLISNPFSAAVTLANGDANLRDESVAGGAGGAGLAGGVAVVDSGLYVDCGAASSVGLAYLVGGDYDDPLSSNL